MSRRPAMISAGRLALAPALALALLAGGCVSLLPKTKPATLYRFGAEDTAAVAPVAPMSTAVRTVVLAPVRMPRDAEGDGILTVQGEQTAYIAGGRWVAPASTLFREALTRAFDRRAGLRVLARGETGRAGATLELQVARFEARYDGPSGGPSGAPTVRVTLRARLIAMTGQPLAAQAFDVSQPAADNRIGPIVAAYDAATTRALDALAQWVDGLAPPAAEPTRPAA